LPLQDAKARFSQIVSAAMRGRPQHVTRRGKPAVVIVGATDYERLSNAERKPVPSFIDHLLAIPKPPKSERSASEPRPKVRPRDVDLSS
jgi:prevent-host-death family protein